MPLYEYYCPHCEITFTKLRPFSQADAPAACPECHGEDTRRLISTFASFSKGSDGEARSVAGSGGCAGCGASSCAGCGHNH
ncbi:MAG: zinc ribbon domain-containing protein [Chloroflexi bacterium]|nr:zinc ribbon domain-containing protein [Chloroflexota bacterium]